LRNSFPQTAPREAPQRLDPTPVLLKNKVFQQIKQEFGLWAAGAAHVGFFAVETFISCAGCRHGVLYHKRCAAAKCGVRAARKRGKRKTMDREVTG
ncbi:MAG: hypothetical protein LBF64_06395, partial [Oscillospiraceae bacterium]|nr:hypothetical protein [Oscillospiraceae bacterium]